MSSSDTLLIAPQQAFFVDSGVPEFPDLLNGLTLGEPTFMLDSSSDGVRRIANSLASTDFSDLSQFADAASTRLLDRADVMQWRR